MVTYVLAQRPRMWTQHPATYLPQVGFGLIMAVVGITQIIALINSITHAVNDHYLWMSEGGLLWSVVHTIIILLSIIFTYGGIERLLSGLLTTWWLDDQKLNQRYEGLAHSNAELHYNRIAEVSLYQDMFGRIFGYGTLHLTMQGRDGGWTIPNAPNPRELRDYFPVIATKNSHKPLPQ